MSTIAAMNQVQGRITLLQNRLTSFLGDGPAGAGLSVAGRPTGPSFADILSGFDGDGTSPSASPTPNPPFDQTTFPFRSVTGDRA